MVLAVSAYSKGPDINYPSPGEKLARLQTKNAQKIVDAALRRLAELDCKGVKVFARQDLATILECTSAHDLARKIRILMDHAVLQRVAKGIYFNGMSRSSRGYLVEEIACVLRRGHFNYVSLESILSEFGVISQIMISRITVMTTGASGTVDTPFGTIEFTHTKRNIESLHARTRSLKGRPLAIATKHAGAADLRRVGRNTNMIDVEELNAGDL